MQSRQRVGFDAVAPVVAQTTIDVRVRRSCRACGVWPREARTVGLGLAERKSVTKTIATPPPRSLRDGPTPARDHRACRLLPAHWHGQAHGPCPPVRAALNDSYQDRIPTNKVTTVSWEGTAAGLGADGSRWRRLGWTFSQI